ncbi:MAG: glycosyltransferase [Planctomycetota bacterium]
MKVVRVITRLNVGGPGKTAVADSVALAAAGVESVLVIGAVDRHEDEIAIEAPGVRLVRLPELVRPIAPGRDCRAWRSLRDLLRRERPHLVHTHLAKSGVLARLAACSLAQRPRLVHTYHGHVFRGYFSWPVARPLLALERSVAARTDRLIAVSPRVRDELVDRFRIGDRDRFRVVEGGAPDSVEGYLPRAAARAELGLAQDDVVVAVPARLAPIKGHPVLFEALEQLARRGTVVRALLIGGGVERARLEALVARRHLAGQVAFAGFMNQPRRWYSAFDAIVLPSVNEGFPMALLEALLEGVPVIATDVGGVADLVRDGEDGWLVAANQPAALTERLAWLVDHLPEARGMGARGQARLRGTYTPERHRQKLFEVYEELGLELRCEATA